MPGGCQCPDGTPEEIRVQTLKYLEIAGLIVWVIASCFFWVFSFENFRRGYAMAGVKALLTVAVFVFTGVLFYDTIAFHAVYAAMGLILIAWLTVPLKKVENKGIRRDNRFDERDISFSRQRLQPGSDQYREYYSRHPEREKRDTATRALPGLMSSGSLYFNRLNSAASGGVFELIGALHSNTSGEPAPEKADVPAGKVREYIREFLGYQGFTCIGFVKVRPEHFYSHFGRRAENYGKEVPVEHNSAVVIGSKMKERLTETTPLSGEVVETALRYADSGAAAVQIAALLRNLGYSSRAHIDGKYRVIPTLMARDAGMGGFGWSNLFISDIHGSAVRFSVVTTDMEFTEGHNKTRDYLSFCHHCRKCARYCPSKAIDKNNVDRIDSDRCFAYWNAAGTDCGVCMAVCPMNHPWGFFRKLALRSLAAAILLPVLDDFFYGRGKRSPQLPEWMKCD